MKIVEYIILERPNILGIHEEVKTWLNKGWQPYGSPFCRPNSGNVCQAMVKYENT
jgi:hypothetical protein